MRIVMYANRIKEIRKKLNLSVAKMAEKIKIPSRTITGYERNERTPSVEFVAQCCTILNINANWFLTGKGEMFNAPQYEDVKDEILNEVNQVLVKYGIKKL